MNHKLIIARLTFRIKDIADILGDTVFPCTVYFSTPKVWLTEHWSNATMFFWEWGKKILKRENGNLGNEIGYFGTQRSKTLNFFLMF